MEEKSVEDMAKQIEDYLKKMNLHYYYFPEHKAFKVPFVSEDGRQFDVLILIRGNWISTAALAVSKEDLPPDLDEKEFYKILLMTSFDMNEVNFALTSRGDVVVHAESHIKALTYENFEVEFKAVVFGVEFLNRQILPNYPKIRMPSYSELFYVL